MELQLQATLFLKVVKEVLKVNDPVRPLLFSAYRVMCLILTLQGVFLDFCLINCYISQWIFLIDMRPLQALK